VDFSRIKTTFETKEEFVKKYRWYLWLQNLN
jgi:hypothetical protein